MITFEKTNAIYNNKTRIYYEIVGFFDLIKSKSLINRTMDGNTDMFEEYKRKLYCSFLVWGSWGMEERTYIPTTLYLLVLSSLGNLVDKEHNSILQNE